VQESAFFRDAAQFDALARFVVPTLEEPFTIWSAGCANGHEPYSLLMLLDELGYRDIRVCATDISAAALRRTRDARYSAREIATLSPARRDRYLVASARDYEIVPELRARIDVRSHNVVVDPPPVRSEERLVGD